MGSTRNRRSYLSVHTCQAATDHVCVTRANSLAGVDVCRDLKHCTSTLRCFSRKCGKSRIASHLSCKETNITPKTNKQHADTNTIQWEDSNQTESAHRKQRAFSLCCTKARDRNCVTLMEHAGPNCLKRSWRTAHVYRWSAREVARNGGRQKLQTSWRPLKQLGIAWHAQLSWSRQRPTHVQTDLHNWKASSYRHESCWELLTSEMVMAQPQQVIETEKLSIRTKKLTS